MAKPPISVNSATSAPVNGNVDVGALVVTAATTGGGVDCSMPSTTGPCGGGWVQGEHAACAAGTATAKEPAHAAIPIRAHLPRLIVNSSVRSVTHGERYRTGCTAYQHQPA